ncbi:unnamed protein product, partial [marine sediment metagenome]
DNELIPIYGDGSSSRDYTYITDILDGIKSAIKKDLGFETINLGSSDPIKLLDLVNLIQEKMGKEAKLSFLPPQSGDVERTYADVSKADIDYVTGASMAIRRSLWDKLCGFDEKYFPGYFEETDFIFLTHFK